MPNNFFSNKVKTPIRCPIIDSVQMVSWVRWTASKAFLPCLVVVAVLTLLLHSDQRFPLIRDTVLGGEEREGGNSEVKDDAGAKNYWGFSNTNQAKETNEKLEANVVNDKASNVDHPPSKNLFIASYSAKGSADRAVEPEIFSPKPPTQQGAASARREPVNKVLLLSSVGRSGSSFLGQLLAAQENSVYIYEPLRGLPASSRYKDNTEELLRYFNCTVRNTVFQEGPSPNIIIVHFPNVGKKKKQITPDIAVERCHAKPLVIIKTIRTRLSWVMTSMQRNEFDNVKVIHLVRDPRGSYLSIQKLKWGLTEQQMCDNIYRDLQDREVMKSLFPSRYTFVKYEDLCRDPYGQARRLLRFIHGQGNEEAPARDNTFQPGGGTIAEAGQDAYMDLPKGVRDFLSSHLHSNLPHMRDPFTTVRDTSSMYQRWRWIITQEQLKKVEPPCQKAIEAVGHRMFYTFTAVRNASLPLFTDEYLKRNPL